MRFLPDILVLQRDLVKKFQNMADLNYSTIGEFLHCQKAGTGRIRNLRDDLPWLTFVSGSGSVCGHSLLSYDKLIVNYLSKLSDG